MSSEQQIKKLKGHARALADELEWVILCYELIWPTTDRDFQKAFTRDKTRQPGFRIFQRGMARYCILGVSKLTYDDGIRNPTVRRLIINITRCGTDNLRAKLKERFARPIAPGGVPGRPPDEIDLATSTEMDKIEIDEGQLAFDDHISQLDQHWQWFSEHEIEFTDFRDRHLAHLDVVKTGDRYEPPEVFESFGWHLVVEAIDRLIEVAGLLSTLGNESRDYSRFRKQAKIDADNFWKTS